MTIFPQECKSSENVGDHKEKRQSHHEDDDNVVGMEELRNQLESTHTMEVPHNQQNCQIQSSRIDHDDGDIEIIDLSPGDELV